MKKLFLFVLMASQIASAQESWNRCVQSYMPAASPLLDIRTDQVGGQQTLVFRTGTHFEREELHIYYKGKFWKAPLTVDDNFFRRKTVLLNVGADKLCLSRNFRFILTDNSHLSAFSENSCAYTETLNMQENREDHHPTSQEVLTYRIRKDVRFHTECAAGRATGGCDPSQRRSDFELLSRWDTNDCSELQNSTINELINLRTEAIQLFNQAQAQAAN